MKLEEYVGKEDNFNNVIQWGLMNGQIQLCERVLG